MSRHYNYSSSYGRSSYGDSSGHHSSRYSRHTSADDDLAGNRRSVEASMYNNNNNNNNNQSNYLAKRARFESVLPVYPQRPGEKDCAHYMMTRTCKFGESCRFDHPIWVPPGGVPDWKEVALIPADETLPERPGEADCPYYMKTLKCKFGSTCKFNHPKDILEERVGSPVLPDRPLEPICSFYSKTGMCKFGATCKFHHPKNIHPNNASNGQEASGKSVVNVDLMEANAVSAFPAAYYNSKGLPVRPGDTDCPFYMKTGSCKFGATCRYNHPDRNAINPPMATILGQIFPSEITNIINPAANLLQSLDLNTAHTQITYPQRPGEIECDYYMKMGQCKYGETCKFHHPIDRSAAGPNSKSIKLTLAGLPRREGAEVCSFYMKTGTCRFGATCKFDHPPPGEAVAMAKTDDSDNKE